MKQKHSSHVHIMLDRIEITSIMNCSGVFTGENMQANWSSYQKTNMGFGLVAGTDNHSDSNINVVHDPDVMDMPIKTSSS